MPIVPSRFVYIVFEEYTVKHEDDSFGSFSMIKFRRGISKMPFCENVFKTLHNGVLLLLVRYILRMAGQLSDGLKSNFKILLHIWLEEVRRATETPLRVAIIWIKMKYRSSRLRVQ
jgi:hypothetical protein